MGNANSNTRESRNENNTAVFCKLHLYRVKRKTEINFALFIYFFCCKGIDAK